jgi:hypothetical protein
MIFRLCKITLSKINLYQFSLTVTMMQGLVLAVSRLGSFFALLNPNFQRCG